MKKSILLTLTLVLALVFSLTALVIGVSASESEPTFEIKQANLSLKDAVNINYRVVYENVENPEKIELLIWVGDGVYAPDCKKGNEHYSIKNGRVNAENGEIIFTFDALGAAEMTKNVYAKLYYDGVSGETFKYSILEYAYNKLGITKESDATPELKNVLLEMLAYGAAAQQYFTDIDTGALATETFRKLTVVGALLPDGMTYGLYPVGTEVLLTAAPTEELPFVVWTDESGRVLGTDATYLFTVGENNETVTAALSANSGMADAFSDENRPEVYLPFNGNLTALGKAPVASVEYGSVPFGDGFDCQSNGSAYFDGTNYMTLPELKLGSEDFSVAFWVKPTDLAYSDYENCKIPIVSTAASSDRKDIGMSIFINVENGALVVTLGDSESDNGMNASCFFFTPTSAKATSNADRYVGKPLHSELENKWTHFAVVMDRDNSKLRIFMDFAEVFTADIAYFGTSTKLPSDVSADALPFTVGEYGTPVDGDNAIVYIDDLAVFNRAVTAEDIEIMAEYFRELPHEHTASSLWSYDDTAHWHESLCGHKVRIDESEHFIGADGACVSNCGYQYTAPHVHTFSSEWKSDENNHWHEATCEHRELTSDLEAHDYAGGIYCTDCGYARELVITADDIGQGGWSYGTKNTNTNRIRVDRLIYVKKGTVISYNMNGFELYLDFADGEGLNTGDRVGWKKDSGEYVATRDAYLGITIAAAGRTAKIEPSAYNSTIKLIPPTEDGEAPMKKMNVYEFGGEGNDWCFVYLPEDYDPERAEPYPLVIANHGNGWVMNGSFQKANWTNISQYMSAEEIASQPANLQSRYIATEDKTLWYSNPTIEALLDAGYIVAGAQNYADGLYGNDDCANACVDFYNHLQETYNVEEACYMIGASNGAMTTLNAAAKLGDKVKSIILQYPLASVISQYVAGNHREGISTAYGLDASKVYTKEELEALIGEYDPLYADVVDGVKTGYFPSVKIYYSMTDTTTPASANALPLIAMLEKSGITYEGVQVDADGRNKPHGHIDHFDPEAFVQWFENN